MNYNKCIFVGHLTKEPETAFTTTGTEYAKCGIAVNNGYGEKQKVCFIDFVCWSKTAQFLAKHFSKGKPIIIEGELQLDTWKDKESGQNRSKHTINVQSVGFAGGDKKQDTTATVTENQPVDNEKDIPF